MPTTGEVSESPQSEDDGDDVRIQFAIVLGAMGEAIEAYEGSLEAEVAGGCTTPGTSHLALAEGSHGPALTCLRRHACDPRRLEPWVRGRQPAGGDRPGYRRGRLGRLLPGVIRGVHPSSGRSLSCRFDRSAYPQPVGACWPSTDCASAPPAP